MDTDALAVRESARSDRTSDAQAETGLAVEPEEDLEYVAVLSNN